MSSVLRKQLEDIRYKHLKPVPTTTTKAVNPEPPKGNTQSAPHANVPRMYAGTLMYYSHQWGTAIMRRLGLSGLESSVGSSAQGTDHNSDYYKESKEGNPVDDGLSTPTIADLEGLYLRLGGNVVGRNGKLLTIKDWTSGVVKANQLPVGCGGFADVYRGDWDRIPSHIARKLFPKIAIKIPRTRATTTSANARRDRNVDKRLLREIAVWQMLQHPNVVPFLGVTYGFGSQPALIVGWMDNGQLDLYLESHPNTDSLEMAHGVSSGLEYLHLNGCIHGDVNCNNILVNRKREPCIGDFGLSRIFNDEGSLWNTNTVNARGSIRWMSPELLDGSQVQSTYASDVYAFGMTALEIFTRRILFYCYKRNAVVIGAVGTSKETPKWPESITIDPHIENILYASWQPDSRPTMSMVRQILALEMTHAGKGIACSSAIPIPPSKVDTDPLYRQAPL